MGFESGRSTARSIFRLRRKRRSKRWWRSKSTHSRRGSKNWDWMGDATKTEAHSKTRHLSTTKSGYPDHPPRDFSKLEIRFATISWARAVRRDCVRLGTNTRVEILRAGRSPRRLGYDLRRQTTPYNAKSRADIVLSGRHSANPPVFAPTPIRSAINYGARAQFRPRIDARFDDQGRKIVRSFGLLRDGWTGRKTPATYQARAAILGRNIPRSTRFPGLHVTGNYDARTSPIWAGPDPMALAAIIFAARPPAL